MTNKLATTLSPPVCSSDICAETKRIEAHITSMKERRTRRVDAVAARGEKEPQACGPMHARDQKKIAVRCAPASERQVFLSQAYVQLKRGRDQRLVQLSAIPE